MGEAVRVEVGAPPPAGALSPESVQKISQQAREGVTRVDSGKGEERPAWLDPKFKTPEDMAKAYSELQKKMGAGKPAEEAKPPEAGKAPETPKPAEGVKPPEGTVEQQAAEKVVQAAGLNMVELSTEYAKSGELSAESLKKLESVGITKDVVDDYIDAQKARNELRQSDLHSVAGGEEKFMEMHRWSETGLSDVEKLALNKTLESGNHAAIKLAFQGIHAKWTQAGQNEPTRQLEGTHAASAGAGYSHRDEILADMKTPLYHKSEGERNRVLAKIRASAPGIW